MTTYILRGGPMGGEVLTCQSPTKYIVAPRWPPLGVAQSPDAVIKVAYGTYSHHGYDNEFEWHSGRRVPVMTWRGFDS